MKIDTGRGTAACAVVVAVSLGACSSVAGDPWVAPGQAPQGSSAVGRLGLDFTLPGGLTLSSLTWVITNSSLSVNQSGVLNIANTQSIELDVGSLPAGSGYSIQLTGSDSAGDPCLGTASFSIQLGTTTKTVVSIACTRPADASTASQTDTGSVSVEAPVVLVPTPEGPPCPGIMALTVAPATVRVGSASTLTLETVGPTPLIAWSQSGTGSGTFSNASAASPTFACTATGSVTVEATVGLPDSGACAGVAYTSASATIDCEVQCSTAADCPASPTLCAAPACSSNTCVNTMATVGTACTDSGGQICNGGGSCVVPAFDVVRVGDGFSALAKTTAPVFIDTYGLDGGLIGSPVELPTTASGNNQPLTLVGTDTTEGDLATSADGRWLTMLGHAIGTASSTTTGNAVAAFVNAAGTVNTSAVLTSAFTTGVVRSAFSLDGNELWASGTGGSAGGIWYWSPSTLTQLVAATSNVTPRDLRIAQAAGGPQLYADANANPPGLATVGSGTPTSGTQTVTTLPGLPTTAAASPYGFAFFDLLPSVPGVDTLYIADDGTSVTGGLGKWVLTASDAGTYSWSEAWVEALAPPDGGTRVGLRGLAGYATGTTVTLMASTGLSGGASDSLVLIVDTGVGVPAPTVVTTALANETFRGVALPPHE